MSDQSLVAAAVKGDVKSDRGVNGITRNGQTIEAVVMGRVREASQVRSKNVDLTASAAKRGAAREKAVGAMANGKANALVAKAGSDPPATIVSRVKAVNSVSLAKASLTAALAKTVAHQDQGEKSATDTAEAEMEAQQTTDESVFVIPRINHMET